MKKWLFIIIFSTLLCLDRASAATPTLVQHVSASSTQGLTVNSYILRLPNRTLSGNCLVVGLEYASGSGATPSISDDKGNNYSAPASTRNDDGRSVVALGIALNVAAGTQKITITFSGGTPGFVSAMASEFYNVAASNAVDGSSANSGTSSNVTAGNLTTANNGDLIYQYAVDDSVTGPINSWSQGNTPWALLSADLFDGSVAQYQVQTSAGTIDPALGVSPALGFNSIAIALKAANAGTAPPAGIRVVHLEHNSIPPNIPVTLQFPCTGNLIVLDWIGSPTNDITAISDGNGNTYTSTGAAVGFGTSGDNQIYYVAGAKTSTAMMGPNLSANLTVIGGSTAILFDVTGAAAAPFDSTAGRPSATGNQTSSGNVSAVTITPTTANGLVISSIGVNSNTIVGVAPGNFLSVVPSPVDSPNPVDENNGWALNYNSDTSAETFVWTTQGGPVFNWASVAAAFKSAGGGGGGNPDFGLSITPNSQSAPTTGSADYTLTLQTMNGFSGSVQLACSQSNGLPAGAACNLDGQTISPGTSPASLVITTTDVSPATYNFSVVGTSGALTHSASSQLIAVPPAVTGTIAPPASATVSVGGSATFNLTINSMGGFSGQEQVSFACPNAPTGLTCQFNPSPLSIGPNSSKPATVKVIVGSKPAAVPLGKIKIAPFPPVLVFAGLSALAILLMIAINSTGLLRRRSRGWAVAGLGSISLLLLVSLCSCNGGGSGGGGGGGGGAVTVQVSIQATAGGTNTNLGSVTLTVQ